MRVYYQRRMGARQKTPLRNLYFANCRSFAGPEHVDDISCQASIVVREGDRLQFLRRGKKVWEVPSTYKAGYLELQIDVGKIGYT